MIDVKLRKMAGEIRKMKKTAKIVYNTKAYNTKQTVTHAKRHKYEFPRKTPSSNEIMPWLLHRDATTS